MCFFILGSQAYFLLKNRMSFNFVTASLSYKHPAKLKLTHTLCNNNLRQRDIISDNHFKIDHFSMLSVLN